MTDKKYCHDVSNIMDLYIHEELDSYGKEKFEEHISACDECRLLLKNETGVVKAVKEFGEETPDIASAVMKFIVDNKITVEKPKRRLNIVPSLIPAAVAVIAVTLFSRTNIMKMMEKNFDSANIETENAEYESQVAFDAENGGGTESPQWSALKIDDGIAEAAPNVEAESEGTYADSEEAAGMPVPEDRRILSVPEEQGVDNENSIDIQGMTDEYDEEIFNTVKGKLNPSGVDKKAINTLIVLSGEDEVLLAELLQDIEYEEINGIMMADISAFERFKQNADENNFDDFKIYQENTESNVLAFTIEEQKNQGE